MRPYACAHKRPYADAYLSVLADRTSWMGYLHNRPAIELSNSYYIRKPFENGLRS